MKLLLNLTESFKSCSQLKKIVHVIKCGSVAIFCNIFLYVACLTKYCIPCIFTLYELCQKVESLILSSVSVLLIRSVNSCFLYAINGHKNQSGCRIKVYLNICIIQHGEHMLAVIEFATWQHVCDINYRWRCIWDRTDVLWNWVLWVALLLAYLFDLCIINSVFRLPNVILS